jgi:hypothetical protein
MYSLKAQYGCSFIAQVFMYCILPKEQQLLFIYYVYAYL